LCYAQLEQAERRIELLTGADDQGAAVAEPFDDSATWGGRAGETAGVRRRVKARGQGGERAAGESEERLF